MTVREAKIIVPDCYNSGEAAPDSFREQFEKRLVATFGGFTKYAAHGAWVGSSGVQIEPVTVYMIAATLCDNRRLVELAEYVKAELQQDAVYLVKVDGSVHFI